MAGVILVLAVLIVVNVRTFAPRRARTAAAAVADVRVQQHPALPGDLEDVRRRSPASAGLGAPLTWPRPDVARDPFTAAAVAQQPSASPSAPRAGLRPATRGAPAGEPVCSAVMLGAGPPAALIDGRLVGVGDQVRQYVVERIDARGVLLDGMRRLFLPVGTATAGEGAHSIVTGAAPGARAGRSGLVEYAESERN
ncbi:hypothetical protein FJ250_09890 [bacterium]|nr:hypothetical protein [bacterium]